MQRFTTRRGRRSDGRLLRFTKTQLSCRVPTLIFRMVARAMRFAISFGSRVSSLPAWYIVGIEEPLETTLVPAIRQHGYWCFKLKLTGRDNLRDVARTV